MGKCANFKYWNKLLRKIKDIILDYKQSQLSELRSLLTVSGNQDAALLESYRLCEAALASCADKNHCTGGTVWCRIAVSRSTASIRCNRPVNQWWAGQRHTIQSQKNPELNGFISWTFSGHTHTHTSGLGQNLVQEITLVQGNDTSYCCAAEPWGLGACCGLHKLHMWPSAAQGFG